VKGLQKLRIRCWLAFSFIVLDSVAYAGEVSPDIAVAAVKHWLASDGAPVRRTAKSKR
jgi:hypothetical protein